MEVNPREVGTSVAAEENGTENGSGVHLNYSDEDKKKPAPNFFEQNMQEKFENLDGKQAFKIKDGHSDKVSDFQIGGLQADRTFIYGYATDLEDGSGDQVHCGAFYNYQNGSFQVFHEKTYEADALEEGQESFSLQVCMSQTGELGDIFIYDNGIGYIYDNQGGLKFEVDLESFVRRQYPNAYSLSVVKAMTDGDNRIYMEISIEKEQLDIETDDDSGEEKSEEELEEEAERMEQEVNEKVEEVVLVYEFKSVSSEMLQDNEQFDNQIQEWINMASGKSFVSIPDPEADWNTAVSKYPDDWGTVRLTDLNNLPIYQWKDEEKFLLEGLNSVCTFLPYPDSYVFFKDLKGNEGLGKVFYSPDGHYSRIYGKTGEVSSCNTETVSRTLTHVWTELATDDEGNSVIVEKSEEITQTISKDRSRRSSLEEAYTEIFWNMDREKVYTLGNSIGSDILCIGRDGTMYWIRKGGTLEEAGAKLEGDYRPGVIMDGSTARLVASDAENLYLSTNMGFQVIAYKSLGGGYTEGSSAYDQKFDDLNQDTSLGGVDIYSGSDYFTEDNVLRVDLTMDMNTTVRLHMKEPENGWPETGGTKNGFLFSSQSRGLIYYDPFKKESFLLAEGTWYRSFLFGGTCVSVGFVKGDSSYDSLDVAKARVYEYNLNTLCQEMMTAALNEILAREEADRRAASEAEAAAASSTENEGVVDPMEQWNQEYKDKYGVTESP